MNTQTLFLQSNLRINPMLAGLVLAFFAVSNFAALLSFPISAALPAISIHTQYAPVSTAHQSRIQPFDRQVLVTESSLTEASQADIVFTQPVDYGEIRVIELHYENVRLAVVAASGSQTLSVRRDFEISPASVSPTLPLHEPATVAPVSLPVTASRSIVCGAAGAASQVFDQLVFNAAGPNAPGILIMLC